MALTYCLIQDLLIKQEILLAFQAPHSPVMALYNFLFSPKAENGAESVPVWEWYNGQCNNPAGRNKTIFAGKFLAIEKPPS